MTGGWTWFTHVEVLSRSAAPRIVAVSQVSGDVIDTLTAYRSDLAGMTLAAPRIMGVLNVTPDSFSDGGVHHSVADAVRGAQTMAAADILDIGGESTRPGAVTVDAKTEISRTEPVIKALRAAGISQPISIDTRKTLVAQAAIAAGASLVNDVSGFTFDGELALFCAANHLPVCVMHAQGDPATMQQDPHYDNVLLDVYDYLAERIADLTALGIPTHQIIADPGIGFGKTQAHNLALLARISLFHSLGVPVLLGASRKRFIGTIGHAPVAADRMPGSIAVALHGVAQGIQITRVHDVAQTKQAVALWQASVAGSAHG